MNKKWKVLATWVLVLCLGMLAILGPGCQTADVGQKPGDAGEKMGVIKMGAIYSLSGAGSVIGNMQRDAVMFAINQVNERGGVEIDGKKYLLQGVFRDDESKPDVGARRLRELARDGIKVFQGGTMAHIALAISEASKEEKAFFMASCATSPDFFHKDTKAPYSLSILGNAISVGRSGATYAIKEYDPKKLVFFLPDYAFGHQHEEGARQIIKDHPDIDFNVVYSPVGTADLTPYIIQVRDLKPDVVVIGHWGNDAITALKQVHEMGLGKDTKLIFIWIISVFATAVEPESIEGMKALTFWYPDMEGLKDEEVVNATKELTDEWISAIGSPPDAYAMAAWLGVMETVRGMERGQSTDPEKVYNALMENPEFNSPKGPATWRVDGTPAYKYWAFILEGKGPGTRKDARFDFGKVLDAYEGEEFLVPLEDLGWK